MNSIDKKQIDLDNVKYLIESSYESNPSSFDFEAYHKNANEFSEFHMDYDQKRWTIYNSGLIQLYKPEMFIDDTNEDYSLVEIYERNFLINSKRAIPCSRVYKNIHGNY